MPNPPAPPGPRPGAAAVSRLPLHTVQVYAGTGAGVGAHVRSLAAGLAARGLRVTVCAPPGAERCFRFTAAGAHVAPLPVHQRARAVALLRQVAEGADLVHAHGTWAALVAVLALRGRGRVPLVVTWHRRGHPEGVQASVTRLLERRVARAARVVLGATPDLVRRARRRGARDARLAPVALPGPAPAAGAAGSGEGSAPTEESGRAKLRADLGAVARPLVLAVGRLTPDQGHHTLLTAAGAWRELDPQPLVAIAGEGPERAALHRRITDEGLPVVLLGRRDDATALLAAADVAVLGARWTGRSLLAQEALRSGVPLVATPAGSLPELVGDAALLVPYGDAPALARAVGALLGEPELRERLVRAGRERAARWPTEDETVAHVLSVYDEVTGAVRDG
ncbi:glycosyltransferase family 4 protein [Streptomyces sp. GSL17-111]|uniref:glycosyltransferase family 4 protein n=1 Tax=Streptomyces sp. GSL17-111 TaxID=3121596 RepID=UPI0030F4B3BB